MDSSIVVAALPDSAAVAGWVGGWLTKLVGPEWAIALVGLLTSVILDLLESFAVRLAKLPLVGRLIQFWQDHPKVVNPILALLLGSGLGGSWVLGTVAAGVRSMLNLGSAIEKTGLKVTKEDVRRMRGAVALVALLGGLSLLAPQAQAQPAPEPAVADSADAGLSLLSLERLTFALGSGIDLDRSAPGAPGTGWRDPQAFGMLRATYTVATFASLQFEYRRPWEDPSLWGLRGSAFLVFPSR